MLKGFRDFLLRGNLIELATAVIMGTVFSALVKAFTDVLLDILGKVISVPDFSRASLAGINIGPLLSAAVTLVLTGFVVYFAIIVPYNKLSAITKKDDPEVAASSEDLLAEIRDLLRAQNESRGVVDPPARTEG